MLYLAAGAMTTELDYGVANVTEALKDIDVSCITITPAAYMTPSMHSRIAACGTTPCSSSSRIMGVLWIIPRTTPYAVARAVSGKGGIGWKHS